MDINIVDLLRKAPKDIQLYSRTLGPCTVDSVSASGCICNNQHGFREFYRTNGQCHKEGEVILYPRKNVSWDKWPILLEIGHIVRIKGSNGIYTAKVTYLGCDFVQVSDRFDQKLLSKHADIIGWASKEEIAEFNKPAFKPYDKVIVRADNSTTWCGPFSQCVPFNEQTKHLIGTSDPYQG